MRKQLTLLKPQRITQRKLILLNESWSHAYRQTEKRQKLYVEQQSNNWEKCLTQCNSVWHTFVTFATPWRIADDNVWKQEQYDYHTLITSKLFCFFLLILNKLLHFWLLLNLEHIWQCHFDDVDVSHAADYGVDGVADVVSVLLFLLLLLMIGMMMILFLLLMVMFMVGISVNIAMFLFLLMMICCCRRWWWW